MKKIFVDIGALMLLIALSSSQSCDEGQECLQQINEPWINKYSQCDKRDIFEDELLEVANESENRMSGPDLVNIFENDNEIVPDFSRPGQRISITKCYEYIWEMKVRFDRRQQKEAHDLLNWKRNSGNIITQGIKADRIQFPHVGAVGWKSSEPMRDWKFMCGCTLISSKFVLTAAHCSRATNDTSITDVVPKIIRFGVANIYERIEASTAEDRYIARIIVHEKYASPSKYYDIALFELDNIVKFSNVLQPSCLWTEELDQLQNVTVAGWGVTQPGKLEGSPDLLYGSLDLINSKLCDWLLMSQRNRLWHGLEEHQFCAGQLTGGVDACQGDSGGPLQVNIPLPSFTREEGVMHYILGVTSFGRKCGQKNTPSIYTKVSYFVDWIEKHVWG